MSRLRAILLQKRTAGEKVVSIFLTAGYPTLQATLPLLHAIADAGADMIELGVPFSDPQADGATIQEASYSALRNGTNLASVLETAAAFHRSAEIPLLLMGYANPFYQFGWEKLRDAAAAAGIKGLIIPDMPPEESADIRKILAPSALPLIYLVAPNTSYARILQIDQLTEAFIYAVSLSGVTGTRRALPESTTGFLQRLRRQVQNPVLVGFGISSGESAARLSPYCDGVIAGSAIIQRIAAAPDIDTACREVAELVHELKAGVNTPPAATAS